ncbi:MAG: HlyD family secretion protein [Bryobacteraceae bacterium]|nr:HlyD family secretion protein [Bryobacteraceae bacterium]MDW8378621.1 HlyD family efflux transporter periplasmic adaptor subunit [Bryobacterales bacterium]
MARLLVVGFVVLPIFLLLSPWQQSVTGTGRVSAVNPIERQQTIDAPVEGRVVRWHVMEGSRVKAGDPVVDISDIDSSILMRLTQEREAILRRIEAARARELSLSERIIGIEGSRRSALDANASRIQAAIDRIRAAEQNLSAAEATLVADRLNLDRQKRLLEKGLTSTRNLELAQASFDRSVAEVDRLRATLNAERNNKAALEAEQVKIMNDFKAAIEEAKAARAIALTEIANANVELQRIDVRLARQSNQTVKAPRAGTIFRLLAQPGSEVLKASDPLAILIPETSSQTVELWVSGNDAPLITPGRKVRLQFEGWPAIQFVGWPAVAVGTFGGIVMLVDATDNGQGKFRVLVTPDPNDDPWPSNRWLRQGVRTNGWVLLNQVSLGYELWRQFNGFPPVISTTDPDKPKGGEGDKK